MATGTQVWAADEAAPELEAIWKRRLFGMYLFLVAACSIWAAALHARSVDSVIVGDWLINYSGGFVRRGLPGSLVMLLHRGTGAPLPWVAFSLQVSVFLVFLACVYQLAKGIRWSYLMTAVLLSPATLAFTVLDPTFAGLRKEILLFAALGVTIWALMSDRLKDRQLSVMLSILVVGVTLSHEAMLVVAGPYLFAAVLIHTMSLRRAIRICVLPRHCPGGGSTAPRRSGGHAVNLQLAWRPDGSAGCCVRERRNLYRGDCVVAVIGIAGACGDHRVGAGIAPHDSLWFAGDPDVCATAIDDDAVLPPRRASV